ncbi:MAG: RecQ family ATP-dependent DNA helicase, partial [Lachnospiraceae bacterium]|nr:RecQ family ATP-dependent DNA helicase [Lachnospiraceae bacterium]
SAFTATATSEVREDIVRILKLKDPFVLTTGYNRNNLYFEVQKPTNKYDAVVKYLKANPDKSGIVYCLTRKTVEEVTDRLVSDGYNATRYHAGLSEKERRINQDDFIYDRKPIMVATNAFGMGIDKSNVSFVIHYNMPKDIESYYQEAGRAGRDGSNAECILLYGGQDVITNTFLIDSTEDNLELEPEVIEQIKEKERARLKTMTFYCHTNDCLREYILGYFGDKTSNFCGNCSNCNTNFNEVDITREAQMILSCVYRMRERYGVKLLIDTLRGSSAEKVLRLGLNRLSTYGVMSTFKEKQVRDIVNFLVLNGYMFLTNSEYPVVRLTAKANDVLFNGEMLKMKLVKDLEVPVRKVKEEVQVNNDLLTKLKRLRLEIAKREKVPAFIVFSDATLIDMCKKMPVSESEFLDVSGVGQAKLNRYGKEFINEIVDFSVE